ncbi:RNA polymerase sigma-70 factor (ECF subfamily) [Breznakibacter xylanolyticus]|uniref:RNA polymerase sigma-70 factor (ECF subfamily) n=1 Tax=Breznakibacter xylanolyticus TaxID=990 RepID=A0A2W7NI67_9BACT|nr:sigma-70 family RNA polymerase sigma factor [Breznakibacter xylanolyticus]PZX19143.1 RNA polymerase sigma-70 factor (ECF subfamily) [Breznakibacter xylanolyticus]
MSDTAVDIHRDLIEKAREGHPSAQKQLYQLYSRAMFNICCRMMNHTADAEDMLQEAFCDAFRRLDSFRFESSFGAWIKRITINRCINELKRRRVTLEYADQHGGIDPPDEPDEAPDASLTAERIKHAMALLPDGYRVVFSLYYLEGYDHDEIAAILNISDSTSKTQLMRARKKISEILRVGRN